MKIILILLATFYASQLSSQELKIGLQQSFNTTNFLTEQTAFQDGGLNTVVTYPSIGLNIPLVPNIFLEQEFGSHDQVNNQMAYEGYRYHYGLWSSITTLSWMADSNFYAGAGIPLSYLHTATQSNEIGTIDLIARGNAPELLYGYSIKVGYRHPITSRMILYADLSRIEFLNSLDTDPNQELKAINYVFSLKAAFSL